MSFHSNHPELNVMDLNREENRSGRARKERQIVILSYPLS
jgi:hypothetical protein